MKGLGAALQRVIAFIAVLMPLALLAYVFAGHGALDDIFNYSPTLQKLIAVLVLAAASLISALIDAKRRTGGGLSGRTIILSCLSILISGALCYLMILPKYLPEGRAPAPSFIKSEPSDLPVRFAAAGDAHLGSPDSRPDITRKILGNITREGCPLFFLLGDLPDHGFDARMWGESLRFLEEFNARVLMAFVPGNHDTLFGGEGLYRRSVLPGRSGPLWRRLDRGRVHFLILDVEWVLQTYTAAQEKWLEDELARIPRRDWCVVMSHTFYFSSGRRREGWDWYDNAKAIAKLVPLFEKGGVDLVLSGHIHQTEVLQRNGVTYAVVGSLGGKLSPPREYVSPASAWYGPGLYGFADVSLDGDQGVLTIRDPDGRVHFRTGLKND